MPRKKKRFNVMLTCIGRRVSLLECFRKAAKSLKIDATFFGTEIDKFSPALELCDEKFIVKPTSDKRYINQILKLVKENRIDLIVPTVDLDLKVLAVNKGEFEKLGCKVLISNPEVINICQDKRKTYKFLVKNGIDTPATVSARKVLQQKGNSLPCFLKPWDGYASRGNRIVRTKEELKFFSKRIPNCIVQEYVEGKEYTCDVFVDMDGLVKCVVPRLRIETRSGEVSKGKTVSNNAIIKTAKNVVEKLGAGPGVITIQMIVDSSKNIKVIEINPRVGGGLPLSIKAGADSPKWILQMAMGKKVTATAKCFKSGLTMLRYDSEVWIQ